MSLSKVLVIPNLVLSTVPTVYLIIQVTLMRDPAGRTRRHGLVPVRRMGEDRPIILFAGVKMCVETTCAGLPEEGITEDMRTASRSAVGCGTMIGNVLRRSV